MRNGGDVGEVVQNNVQTLLGQQGLQGKKDVLGLQGEQADEEVDAHEQGKQGKDKKIGQGRRRPGHAHPVVGLF